MDEWLLKKSIACNVTVKDHNSLTAQVIPWVGKQGLARSCWKMFVATGLKKSRISPSRGTNCKKLATAWITSKSLWSCSEVKINSAHLYANIACNTCHSIVIWKTVIQLSRMTVTYLKTIEGTDEHGGDLTPQPLVPHTVSINFLAWWWYIKVTY